MSCRALVAGDKAARDPRPLHAALVSVCRRALAAVPLEGDAARQFFEDNFRPARIARIAEETGLLTGYYEPTVEGSRFPTGEFSVPLYRRPPDLVHFDRKNRKEIFPNKGRVARRIARGKYVPYFDRAAIEDGALYGRHLEICYLKSWDDVLFMQIQGSARVRLEDGLVVRVNYDAHNGQPQASIGRLLIERNLISRDVMSMDRIRTWMTANPSEAAELRRMNKSFVFFRVTGLSEFDEAAGAQGVPLTPVRSIAVDKQIHVYGTPFFIEAELPIASNAPTTPFRRLMIAQDTGSAINGPARADIFFGAGDEAGKIAGRIKQQGRFAMLVPRELDLVEAGKEMPPAAGPSAGGRHGDAAGKPADRRAGAGAARAPPRGERAAALGRFRCRQQSRNDEQGRPTRATARRGRARAVGQREAIGRAAQAAAGHRGAGRAAERGRAGAEAPRRWWCRRCQRCRAPLLRRRRRLFRSGGA